jgi:hypothetical protein
VKVKERTIQKEKKGEIAMRKMWKKAAITAMAGTMMMMTGCALEGGIDLGKKKPAETLSTSKAANSSDASQASSAIPNTSGRLKLKRRKQKSQP